MHLKYLQTIEKQYQKSTFNFIGADIRFDCAIYFAGVRVVLHYDRG